MLNHYSPTNRTDKECECCRRNQATYSVADGDVPRYFCNRCRHAADRIAERQFVRPVQPTVDRDGLYGPAMDW